MMLRPLRREDLPALRDINEFSLGYAVSLDVTAKQWEKLSQDPHHFFVGYEDEASYTLVGYIHAEVYESLYSDTGFNVLGLAVLEEYQGKGIGKQLLLALEKEAEERGYSFIRLNSASHRTEAHAFYQKAGYDGDKTQVRFIKYM